MSAVNVLVTGAGGYIGSQVTRALRASANVGKVVAMDVRERPAGLSGVNIEFAQGDVRDSSIASQIKARAIDVVIHLASIVTPGKNSNREFEYSVDVLGTRNVLDACLAAGVEKIIVTSSGAAYGYHADNPAWLKETDPLRGNPEFAYSDHKRQVEEMLRDYRQKHPKLKQLVFRPGTVIGGAASNQITALFEKPVVMGVAGSDSPFVFIWDQDVVDCIVRGATTDLAGIYNLAGDGALSLREIAGILGKPYLPIPRKALELSLKALRKLGLTRYGPEQIAFLQYRPVLSNENLKSGFHYVPRKTSREAFLYYLDARRNLRKNIAG